MPVSYIDVPHRISPADKEQLVRAVSAAIHEGYPIPDTRVLIREWRPESVGQDGKIEMHPMRPICVLEVPPGLSVEGKRRIVERISTAVADACHLRKDELALPNGTVITTRWVLTFFHEIALENAPLDGLVASDNAWFSRRWGSIAVACGVSTVSCDAEPIGFRRGAPPGSAWERPRLISSSTM